MTNVVFCTTCKNRVQHLQQTLPQNLMGNPKSKFIILNYNTEDHLLEYLFSEHATEIEQGRLVVYSYPHYQPKFRMAHAKNMAHRLGILEGGDILVNLDADNIAGDRFEDFIIANFENNKHIFLWANMIKGVLVRGISGRIVVTKRAFLKIGGYDEKFKDWGMDDKDFNLRLQAIGYEGVEIDPVYLSGVSHNDKIRFKEYPHRRTEQNEYMVDKSTIKKIIANRGHIGCGVVYRNKDETPIYLNRLPTKIFGIGMHKTATTSLHHALEILGYDSWHWSTAHDAKAIWQKVNNETFSPIIEWFQAACDLPIPLLYKQLDVMYPGSKFILTIRNEQNWLDAVRRHFDPEHNPWRKDWDGDPFSHRVHHLTYGRQDFDAENCLLRYREHNQFVRDYFRHRPEDLLVMHVKDGIGWSELCEFLEVAIPNNTAYPQSNRG
jgi:PAS domain-containing protein